MEEAFFDRRGRVPALTVRGNIFDRNHALEVTNAILPKLSAIKALLPLDDATETAGAADETAKGGASDNAIMPLMVLVMLSLLMLQMQSFSRMAW